MLLASSLTGRVSLETTSILGNWYCSDIVATVAMRGTSDIMSVTEMIGSVLVDLLMTVSEGCPRHTHNEGEDKLEPEFQNNISDLPK